MTASTESNRSTLAVDSHVHLYHQDDLIPALDATVACHNALHQKNGAGASAAVVLVLAEPSERNTFARLRRQLESDTPATLSSRWQLHPTAENISLVAKHIEGAETFLIGGQQIVTSEQLEVLSIATEQSIADRLPLATTLAAVEKAGGFAILPWGVGKWFFERGDLICKLIRANAHAAKAPFALGDNGGRPRFWEWVTQFDMAKAYDIPIISGSDPLPVSGPRRGAASYGTLLRCHFDHARPAASLLTAITERACEAKPFGTLARPTDFMQEQLALRLRRCRSTVNKDAVQICEEI